MSAIGLNYDIYAGWTPEGDKPEIHEAEVREERDQMTEWCVEGRLRPFCSRQFTFEDYRPAMTSVLGRHSRGKVAIVFPDAGGRTML